MKKSKTLMIAVCIAASFCLTVVVMAQETAKSAAPAKGEAVLSTLEVRAQVASIDHKTRKVTLKADDGEEYTFVADQAVKNLDQVKKGDMVVATYVEALAYEVKKGGTAGASTTVAAGAAKPGEKPAGAIGQSTTVTVVITAIDAKAPSVTVKGPGGVARTIKVKDPAKLQGVSVGDTVELTYIEAVALKVEKATKK